MKALKKIVAIATVLAMAGSTVQAEDCSSVAGCGYQECCASPCMTPAIALGAIAVVAIVAIALQNSNSGHGHHHAH